MMTIKKAIIRLSGREVLVKENDRFQTLNLNKEVGESFEIPTIFCFDENNELVSGQVKLEVKKNFLGKKCITVKKKRRTRTFRTRGFRPSLTTVEVQKISVKSKGGK